MNQLFQLRTTLDSWIFRIQDGSSEVVPVNPDIGSQTDFSSIGRYVAIILVLVAIVTVLRFFLSDPKSALKNQDLTRSQRKAILSASKGGDIGGAADLAWEYGAFEDAAEFFVQMDNHIRAAEAFEKANKRNDAVYHYKQAGRYENAANLLEKSGQLRAAAHECAQNNNYDRAAQLYLKANDFRQAAEMFVKTRNWKHAGEAYERLNLREEATEMYDRFFQEQFALVRGNLDDIPEAREKARFISTFHLHDKKDHTRAAKILEKAGYLEEAAQLFASNNDIANAARLYTQNNQPLAAAKLYEFAGDEEKAALYRGEAALKEHNLKAAATEFARAKEYQRAADLFAAEGEHILAAEMFESVRDLRAAADHYIAAQDLKSAARCFENLNDWVRAGELYQTLGDLEGQMNALARSGDWFRIGQLLFQQDRKEEALAAMQKVEATDLHYREACEFQGDILCEIKRFDVGYLKYRQAVTNIEPNTSNLVIFYKMARCLEEIGDYPAAQGLYEEIIAVDFYYKDTKARLDRIDASIGAPPISRHIRSSGNHDMGISSGHRNVRFSGSHSAHPMNPQVQRMPARYKIVDEIARGGMGVVYRAQDTVLGRIVAFKILSENLKGNPTAVKYFLREAQAVAALSHPNIVTVYDAGEQDGEYYMAMEYVEGDTLKNLIVRNGPFHEKLLRFILDRSCRGLAYAHDRGIVHRDIKSGNIMLTREKSLKIMDFGLAKVLDEYNNQHTQAIGTPFYMSPEQILGRDLDHRSDLYSLGITLFECATGQVPFPKGELSYHHLHTQPPSPREFNKKLSKRMSEIILTLMRKDPNERYPDAGTLLKSLKKTNA